MKPTRALRLLNSIGCGSFQSVMGGLSRYFGRLKSNFISVNCAGDAGPSLNYPAKIPLSVSTAPFAFNFNAVLG